MVVNSLHRLLHLIVKNKSNFIDIELLRRGTNEGIKRTP